MTNKEYLETNRSAFKRFIFNNYDEFKSDKSFFIESLEYYAHCFGAGIRKDGTEDDVVSNSYSVVLVNGLFGTGLGIPIDAKIWNGWIRERVGAAYERQGVAV